MTTTTTTCHLPIRPPESVRGPSPLMDQWVEVPSAFGSVFLQDGWHTCLSFPNTNKDPAQYIDDVFFFPPFFFNLKGRLSSVLGGTIAKMNKPGADDAEGEASSAALNLPHFFASPYGVGVAVGLLEICTGGTGHLNTKNIVSVSLLHGTALHGGGRRSFSY